MIIFVLLFIVNQYLVAKAFSSNNIAPSSGSNIQLSDNATETEVIKAILPKDSETTRPYEWKGQKVTLSAQTPGNGYDMLADMNNIQLTDADQQSRFNALTKSIYHPCCDAPISSCGCKHSVSAKGVIKFLLGQNYTDDQIRDEVFLWNRYWWPKHYATAAVYLNSQGTNPASINTKDWLGPKLSTIRSGRKMKAALGK